MRPENICRKRGETAAATSGRAALVAAVMAIAALTLILPGVLQADQAGTRSSDDICYGGGCHSNEYSMWFDITSHDIPSSIGDGESDRVTIDVDVDGKANWRLYEFEYECSIEVFVASKYGNVEVEGSPAEETGVFPGFSDTFRFDITGAEEGDDTLVVTVRMSNSNHKVSTVSESVEEDLEVVAGTGGGVTLTAPEFYSQPDSPDDDGSFTLRWTGVDGADSYVLEEDTRSSFSSPEELYSGSSRQYDVDGLNDGTYYYRVKAVSAGGDGVWSTDLEIRVDTGGSGGDGSGDGGEDGEGVYEPDSGGDESTPGFSGVETAAALLAALILAVFSGRGFAASRRR